MLTIAGNVVKYLRYWKTALKNRAFRCCFQREGDGESPSASLSAASLERPRESAAGASRYRSAEICASIIRVVPRLTSPLSWGRGFMFESPRQKLPLGTRGAVSEADCGDSNAANFGSTLNLATNPLRHFLRKCHLPLPRGARQEAALERGSRRQRAAVICLKFNVYRRSISSWHTNLTASMSCARCT